MAQRPHKQLHHFVFAKRLQHKNAAARQKGAVNLKRGIFRCRAYQNNAAFFYKWQKSVLLRFIKAVDFVYKQQRAAPHAPAYIGSGHNLFNLFDSACDRAKIDKFGFGMVGNHPGERGFANARWSPENHRANLIVFNKTAQNLSRTQQMLLAHYIF